MTVIQYGNALEALHGVQVNAETGILVFLEKHPGLFDYESRRKLPALESDLAALGRIPIRFNTKFPIPETIAALVGILYTVEGSAQGGQVIARALQELPLENLPTKFFTGYGELSQQRWIEFLQFADIHCLEDERGIAVATAVSVFDAIKNHLDNYLNHLEQH